MMHKIEKAISILAASFFACFFTAASIQQENPSQVKKLSPGRHTFTLITGKLQRSYIVYVPTSYNPETQTPIVIMFHGGGGTAMGAMRETGWTKKAEKEGFLAVFPEGTREDPTAPARFATNGQTWNDGSNRSLVGAVLRKVNDVEFVERMMDDLLGRFAVDKNRVYATGFSNGASMAFRVGRELSQSMAAIAPVAGSDWSDQETIDRPVSMLYMTGTADPLNPMEGGEIRIVRKMLGLGNKPPVADLIQKWIRLLGCQSDSHVLYEKDGVRGIGYGPGKDHSEVVLYTIEGMGHTWPGGISLLPERMVGKTSNKIKATDIIWDFFEKHPIK